MQRQRDPFIVGGRFVREVMQAHQHGLQGVFDFMRNPSRQGADAFQFRGLDQLQLGRLQFLVGRFEFLQCPTQESLALR